MDLSYLLNNYLPNENNLKSFGFEYINNAWIYKIELETNGLYAKFVLNKTDFKVNVYDSVTNDIYLPFNLNYQDSSYAVLVRNQVEVIKDNILKICFENTNIKEKLVSYLKDKYGTMPEYPWKQYPEFCTFKTNNKNKWYGIIMNIDYKKLGIDIDDNIDVINIKLPVEKIEKLIDKKIFFPAYHMNKKYWISILLNNNIDFETLTNLIDESYELVDFNK